jgi:hypothetical protein
MAISNAERIGKCLELLNQGLAPYIDRELKRGLGKDWLSSVQASLRDHQSTGLKKRCCSMGYATSSSGDDSFLEASI